MPKIGNCKVLGVFFYQGRPQYTQISTLNMYLIIEIRYTILIICHGNYIKVKRFNCMLENVILRISSLKIGCPEG